ncbi:MAG: hypothetical protein GXO89_06080 [Chlorobi bacterium]|nr:hypothetical protein [Chlorobiota bacterium]
MKTKQILKWTARILGGIAIIFFLTFAIGEGVPDMMEEDNGQLRSIMLLFAFATLGYVFGWFREREGGVFMMVAGFLLGADMYYYGGTNDIMAVLVYSLPFIVPGILFFLVGKKEIKD